METMRARRSRSRVIQTLRDYRCQPRLLYPAKLSITIEGQNKVFQDKTRFHQYLVTNPALHKILKGKLNQRKLTTPIKTQTIDCLIKANPKERENAQINITNNEN